MSIAPGTRLDRYEILAPLGAGGMGEVHLARDTELKRDVAIKVLPDSVARDAERVARFEREARLLASINHPNIAGIFGLERGGGVLYLVLELVEGDTLTERMASGTMNLREVLDIFRQIALACEAAHAKGIVHRDLKPDNIKITPEGVVKVLDFGLAKVFIEEEISQETVTKTKTAPVRITHENDILGTPAYMSPEQARGQPLDKRSDIWSFGCCLYEALTGHHPFSGATVSDVLVAVLSREPEFGTIPRGVPGNIRRVLKRCLKKDPRERLHDIGDARIELEEAIQSPAVEEELPGLEGRGRAVALWSTGVAMALGLGFLLGRAGEEEPPDERLRRFAVELPATEPIALASGPSVAISRDGNRIIYAALRGDSSSLRMRSMDRLDPTELPGTNGATIPFFEPAGDAIGYFANGKLARLSLGDLTVRNVEASTNPRGGSWGSAGDLLFSPRTVGGLELVTAPGLRSVPLTTIGSEGDERSHRWPSFLPDGRHALFTNWTGDRFDIEVVSLDTGGRARLIENGSFAKYAASGHLVFMRDDVLHAVAFDPDDLEIRGAPVAVLEDVHWDPLTGAAFYDISSDGTLVYVPRVEVAGSEVAGRLLRVDPEGSSKTLLDTGRSYQVPRLSPDGDRLIVTLTDEDRTDIWLSELNRRSLSRLTNEGNNGAGIWTPDGSRVTFSSDRDGPLNLYWQPADGSGPAQRLTVSDNAEFPSAWSPDGQKLAFTELNLETSLDLWIYSVDENRSTPFLETSFNESGADFSPDGRYLVYVSDETGTDEVYVREFPGPGGKRMISSGGGVEPVWSADGDEIYYRDGEWVIAVAIRTDPSFDLGQPRHLFEAPFDEAGAPYANYDVDPSNDNFIMVRSDLGLASTRLIVVLNWVEELERRAPAED